MRRNRVFTFMMSLLMISAAQAQDVKPSTLEYWFDKQFDTRQSLAMSGEVSHQIDVSQLCKGVHTLEMRVSDTKGRWSSPCLKYFLIPDLGEGTEKVVAYEYWFNDGPRYRIETTGQASLDVSNVAIEIKDVYAKSISDEYVFNASDEMVTTPEDVLFGVQVFNGAGQGSLAAISDTFVVQVPVNPHFLTLQESQEKEFNAPKAGEIQGLKTSANKGSKLFYTFSSQSLRADFYNAEGKRLDVERNNMNDGKCQYKMYAPTTVIYALIYNVTNDAEKITVSLSEEESTLPAFAGVDVQEGDEFYLYNVESGLWLQDNNRFTADWNTHGELGTTGFDVNLIKIENGWQINPKFGHNQSMNSTNLYLDTVDPVTTWQFVPVDIDGESKTYYIKNGDKYLRAGDNDKLECTNIDTKNVWQIVTRQERIDFVKTTTKNSPKDISFLIRGNEFTQEDTRLEANWVFSDNDSEDVHWNAGRFDVDNRQNSVFEVWNMTKMNLSQTVSGLPAGYYELEVRAAESPTDNAGVSRDLLDQYNAGTLQQYGVLYANDETVTLPSIYSEQYAERTGHFAARELDGIWMMDGINQFCYAVANSETAYKVVTAPVKVDEGGNITLGVKVEGAPSKTVWVMVDKFRLRYLGDDPTIGTSIKESVHAGSTQPLGIFNLNGQKITKLQKGINIVNGKKIIVK